MLQKNSKDLGVEFLRCLSKIKGWQYHDKIEEERNVEIREFLHVYVLKEKYGSIAAKISFNRVNFFVQHPFFKPTVKALLTLLYLSATEEEFQNRHKRMSEMESI